MPDATLVPGESTGDLTPLHDEVPLRHSILWDLQRAFYENMHVAAWRDAIVPNFVTSNAYIAMEYAKVIFGAMKDWVSKPAYKPSEPIYILEVGAGHGKFTYLLLREIQQLMHFAGLEIKYKYIISDFTEDHAKFWLDHSRLRPFFESGVLDYAIFDAESHKTLHLQKSNQTIGPGDLSNPLFVVCNYIFDTLRQDAFRIVEGQLQEALVQVYATKPDFPREKPTVDSINHVKVGWTYRPCTYEVYKSKPLQTMLQVYTERCKNASVLVPIGGITALSHLCELSNGRLVLLAGDKAYNHEEELWGLRDPHVAVHGSFSFMVNFHAVRLYTLARGGFCLQTPSLDGFKCCAFVLGLGGARDTMEAADVPAVHVSVEDVKRLAVASVTEPALQYPELLCAWADTMDTFGPENFSTLQRCIKDEIRTPHVKTALATIRMANWDPDVFYKFKQIIIESTPSCGEKLQLDIFRDVKEVLARYYPLQPTRDISFELGRICMGLKRWEKAVELFNASRAECGNHHTTWYNIGICHWYQDDWNRALEAFNASLELRSDYEDAANWRLRVEAKLRGDEVIASMSSAVAEAEETRAAE